MARAKYELDEAAIVRKLKACGKGRGSNYRPFLKVREVPSKGLSNRPLGIKTGRVHHFLSNIERDLFYLLDWQDAVVDIREQFPLDRAVTLAIAHRVGIGHATYKTTGATFVMTTDFLVNVVRGAQEIELAYSVKLATDLDDVRTLEKLEIERLYWEAKGIPWSIVTEDDIPQTLVRNIDWVHGYQDIDSLEQPHVGYYRAQSMAILEFAAVADATLPLGLFCAEADMRLALDKGESLTLVRHLLATKILKLPENLAIDTQTPIASLMPVAATKVVRA